MAFAHVAFDVPLATLFDFSVPAHLSLAPGQRVAAHFGSRIRCGVVLELTDHTALDAQRIKPIAHVLDDAPLLRARDLELVKFCADYYHHPIGETLFTALPPALRRVRALRANSGEAAHVYRLAARAFGAADTLLSARAVKMRRVMAALAQAPLAREELLARVPGAAAAIKSLLARGLIETAPPSAMPAAASVAPALTDAQSSAARSVIGSLGAFSTTLLFGITGSGKTEVYFAAIDAALARGGQVLLLVPEINLTPRLEALLAGRFPQAEIASLHSSLAEGERLRRWHAAREARAHIVLGTRLAVFTPLPRLALIIVDEEHDASYKQQEGLKFSARDVAIYRAKQADAPIVLGSATPSLETWFNAHHGRYRLITLAERAHAEAKLPTIRTLDLAHHKLVHGLSRPLLEAIDARLARGEQSLVFINRRGYAPALVCGACGWLAACPRCTAKLVLHKRAEQLRCHYCGAQQAIPRTCPTCGSVHLGTAGQGTERIADELATRFPAARITRIDRDTASRKRAVAEALERVAAGDVDILVGTQMLAKGHDFPRLTLVGVLNADSALYSTDFRAAERLFALITQVAGRAGRAALPGEVLIQTHFPRHPIYAAIAAHDYATFARYALAERAALAFPPHGFQAVLRAESVKPGAALAFCEHAAERARALALPVRVFDAVPALMARIAGKERAQLLVQSESRTALQRFLSAWLAPLREDKSRTVRWGIDVDPIEL